MSPKQRADLETLREKLSDSLAAGPRELAPLIAIKEPQPEEAPAPPPPPRRRLVRLWEAGWIAPLALGLALLAADNVLSGMASIVIGAAWVGAVAASGAPRRVCFALGTIMVAALGIALSCWSEMFALRNAAARTLHDFSPLWWWLSGTAAAALVGWRLLRLSRRTLQLGWLLALPLACTLIYFSLANVSRWRNQRYAVLGSMSEMRAACDQFRLEHGVTRVEFEQIVGPDRYLRSITNDLADYRVLFPHHLGDPWAVTMRDGRRFELK